MRVDAHRGVVAQSLQFFFLLLIKPVISFAWFYILLLLYAGKLSWIEWVMFCDKLNKAFTPLPEKRAKKNSSLNWKEQNASNNTMETTAATTSTLEDEFNRMPHAVHKKHSGFFAKMFTKRRGSKTKTKVLKRLQKVVDQEAQRFKSVQFILFCPHDDIRLESWHIQILVTPDTNRVQDDTYDNGVVPLSIVIPNNNPMDSNQARAPALFPSRTSSSSVPPLFPFETPTTPRGSAQLSLSHQASSISSTSSTSLNP